MRSTSYYYAYLLLTLSFFLPSSKAITHSQGTHRDSLWLSGAADSSQGPWEPGVLRAALSLGGKATAEGALLLPFASL